MPEAARRARAGAAADLADALRASRADTLATFAAYERALPDLSVPQRAELNPPLWELGHIGWFQAFWVGLNPVRAQGHRADPDVARRPAPHPGRHADAEALYHSSRVPHERRWSLPLPDAAATRAELAAQLEQTLALLARVDAETTGGAAGPAGAAGTAGMAGMAGAADNSRTPVDDALYFFRLALLHEDMHHEAALYMAQGLGVPIDDPRWQGGVLPEPPRALEWAAGRWRQGSEAGTGFAFDNELHAHDVVLAPTSIDAQVLRWAEYLPFVEQGGYADARWWSAAGWRWRGQTGAAAPRYLRRDGAAPARWQQWRHGRWQALDLRGAACHLTFHEAEAWCAWAGRRLPTEAEWERAACLGGAAFRWGDVWEWTASAFAPYAGFEPHPYRDYSAPWFDGRPVLRGGSFMTQPRMKHPRYRNFFQPQRNDVLAGLRTCAR